MKSLQQATRDRGDGVIFAQVKQHINTPSLKDKIVILVEGDTDITLFNLVFRHKALHYLTIQSGKPEVIKSVSNVRPVVENPLYGIVDADFDHIMGGRHEGVMLTDKHDSEIMMLNFEFMISFITEYLKTEFLCNCDIESKASHIFNGIMKVCHSIGVFKLVNAKYSLNMNFKGLSHLDAGVEINNFDVCFNPDLFLAYIVGRSRRFDAGQVDFVLMKYKEELEKEYCSLQVSNGHDFCGILSLLFKQDFSNNKNISQKDVEVYLRSKYAFSMFKETQLHNQLVAVIENETGKYEPDSIASAAC
ncbi:MAG: hypothetical protein ACRCUW_00805 [Plesiomonas shigelloides]